MHGTLGPSRSVRHEHLENIWALRRKWRSRAHAIRHKHLHHVLALHRRMLRSLLLCRIVRNHRLLLKLRGARANSKRNVGC